MAKDKPKTNLVDDWQELEVDDWQEPTKPPSPGLGEAIARGGTKGLTYGFADEASGLLGAATEPLFMKSDKDFKGRYEEYRNAYRKGDKAAAKAHPTASTLSELAGGIAAPGGVAAKGVGRGAGLIRAAGQGSLNAYGLSEADNAGDAISDTIKGGALGAGGQAVGGLLSKFVPTAKGTGDLATRKAIQHLRPTPKVAQSLGPEKLAEVGKEALDSGSIGFFSRAGKTAENLEGLREKAGAEIGEILESTQAKADPIEVAARIRKEVIDPLSGVSGNNSIVKQLEGQLDDFLSKHTGSEIGPQALGANSIPAGLLEQEKRAVQKGVNYMADPSGKVEAQMKFAKALQGANEDAISAANPLQGEAFKAAKKRFGNLSGAEAMAKRTGALTDGGTGLMGGLMDMSAGNMALNALLHGEPVTGGLIAGGRALGRGRVNSSIAVPAHAISEILKKNPKSDAALQFVEQLIQKSAGPLARQSGSYKGSE